jgi:dihydrodipicolinate synthase/N-acetylneuraminate lyase
MSQDKLHGVVVPVITPVDKKENVDEAAFRRILRRLVVEGAHCIFVGGSAGEGPLLVESQWRRMVEIAFDEVGNDLPLFGGVMDTSARRVCEKITALKKIGYRHFVLTPSYYYAVRAASEQLRLFGQAKEAAGKMEMIAYNIPQCTGAALDIDMVCEMAKRGWVRYCKESSGDLKYLKTLIRKGEKAGLDVLVGDELIMADGLLAGGKGIVPVCANYDPKRCIRIYEAGARRDRKALAAEMPEFLHIRETLLLSGPCWISGIKHAMAALGYGSGLCVSPLEPADAKRRARIDAMIGEHREDAAKPADASGVAPRRSHRKGSRKALRRNRP